MERQFKAGFCQVKFILGSLDLCLDLGIKISKINNLKFPHAKKIKPIHCFDFGDLFYTNL